MTQKNPLNNRIPAPAPPNPFIHPSLPPPGPYSIIETLTLLHKEHSKGHYVCLKGFQLLLPEKVILQVEKQSSCPWPALEPGLELSSWNLCGC